MMEVIENIDVAIENKSKLKELWLKIEGILQKSSIFVGDLKGKERDGENKNLDENIDIQKLSLEKKEIEREILVLEKDRQTFLERRERAFRTDKIIQYEYERVNSSTWDLKKQVKDIESLNKEVVGTEMENLKRQIDEANEEGKTCEDQVANAASLLISNESYKCKIKNNCQELKKSLEDQNLFLEKEKDNPKLTRKKTAQIEIDAQNWRIEITKLRKSSNENQRIYLELENKRKSINEVKSQLNCKIDMELQTIHHKQSQLNSLESQLEAERSSNHILATTRVDQEISIREIMEQLRHCSKHASLIKSQLELLKQSFVRKKLIVDQMKETTAQMNIKLKDNLHNLKIYNKVLINETKSFDEIKEEIEVSLAKFLQQENLEREEKEKLKNLNDNVGRKESEIDTMRAEETKRSKLIRIMKIETDATRRKSTEVNDVIKEVQRQVVIQKSMIGNYSRICKDIIRRQEEVTALYQTLRTEKMELANAQNLSNRALAEMVEKVKNLSCQFQKIQVEEIEKEKIISKESMIHERNDRSKSMMNRELINTQKALGIKQDGIKQLNLQIHVSLSIKSNIDRAIDQLNAQVQRMSTSNKLAVDLMEKRKEEIHKLFLRANLYEEKMKQGSFCLHQRREDIKSLQLMYSDMERQIVVAKNNVLDVKECNLKICSFEVEIEEQKNLKVKLCKAIEDPSNKARWRNLEGSDLDEQQLEAKRGLLEQRISEYKEILLERSILLKETSSQTEMLRRDHEERSGKSSSISRKLNDEHAKVRDLTRSMMALVSELSMYQATAIKLKDDKEIQLQMILKMKENLKSGQPPNEGARRDLMRLQNQKKSEISSDTNIHTNTRSLQYLAPRKLYYQAKYALRTTAEPRPGAYIPESDMSLPKPYGAMAPFKPTENGTTIRHIRQPIIKAIEI